MWSIPKPSRAREMQTAADTADLDQGLGDDPIRGPTTDPEVALGGDPRAPGAVPGEGRVHDQEDALAAEAGAAV